MSSKVFYVSRSYYVYVWLLSFCYDGHQTLLFHTCESISLYLPSDLIISWPVLLCFVSCVMSLVLPSVIFLDYVQLCLVTLLCPIHMISPQCLCVSINFVNCQIVCLSSLCAPSLLRFCLSISLFIIVILWILCVGPFPA